MNIVKKNRVLRLLKLSEPIKNSILFSFSNFLKSRQLEDPFNSLTKAYSKDTLEFLKQYHNINTLKPNYCIPYKSNNEIKILPQGFTEDGDLLNSMVIPNKSDISISIEKLYNEYIRLKLYILNIDRCKSYYFNIDEFSTKKELLASLSSKKTSYRTGYNEEKNLYWVLNIKKVALIELLMALV